MVGLIDMRFAVCLLMGVAVIGCSKKEPVPQPVHRRPPVNAGAQAVKLPPPPKMLPSIEAANQRYRAVPYPTTQSELLRAWGKPKMTNKEGVLIWETSEGLQSIVFTAKFKPDGTMTLKGLSVTYDTSNAVLDVSKSEPGWVPKQ